MTSTSKDITAAIHSWIRDCGLDVQDIQPFVDRELMPLIAQAEKKAELRGRVDELEKAVSEIVLMHPADSPEKLWYNYTTKRLAELKQQEINK